MVVGNSKSIVIPRSYRGLRVLLVGCDACSLKYIKSTLEHHSYKVTCAESPAVALSVVGKEESKYYDLVITDLDSLELDFFIFFNHIILNTDLPIILVSCNGNDDILRKALNQEACFFLRKPVCRQILASVWQHVFRVRGRQTINNINGQGKQILQENDLWEGNIMDIDGDSSQAENKVHAMENISNGNSNLLMNQETEDCPSKIDEDNIDNNSTEEEKPNKKSRLYWTDELRIKFNRAVKILGEEKARPKEILKLMGVSTVTLRHVSSHLQKHREKMRRSGNNYVPIQPHYRSKSTYIDHGMERKYQNGNSWDLHDLLNRKRSLAARTMIQPMTQNIQQQHVTESSLVHYEIDMIKKLLDKGKDKKANHCDYVEAYIKGKCYEELTVERDLSSLYGSNLNGREANIFQLQDKGFNENLGAMILNPNNAAASELYIPDIYMDYLAPNDSYIALSHANMGMSFLASDPNSSGVLEDIIFASRGLRN